MQSRVSQNGGPYAPVSWAARHKEVRCLARVYARSAPNLHLKGLQGTRRAGLMHQFASKIGESTTFDANIGRSIRARKLAREEFCDTLVYAAFLPHLGSDSPCGGSWREMRPCPVKVIAEWQDGI